VQGDGWRKNVKQRSATRILLLLILSITAISSADAQTKWKGEVKEISIAPIAPFVATFDSAGNTYVVGQVCANGACEYTVISPTNKILKVGKLDGTPFYYGPYPYNPVTKQVIVPLFVPGGGTTNPIAVDAISTVAPYGVTGIEIPNASQPMVAAVASNGNTYVGVLEGNNPEFDLVRIAIDGTQVDRQLTPPGAGGSSQQMLLVGNYLYVVGIPPNAETVGIPPNTGIYIVNTSKFSSELDYTFIPGDYSNINYSGTMLSVPSGNVYIASMDEESNTGVTVLNSGGILDYIPIVNINQIAYNSSNDLVYATADYNGGRIWEIKGTKLVSTTPITKNVGDDPGGITAGADGNIYFSGLDGSIRCLYTATKTVDVVIHLPADTTSSAPALNPVNKYIYAPNEGGPEYAGQEAVIIPSPN
jgi:hypothetical protein